MWCPFKLFLVFCSLLLSVAIFRIVLNILRFLLCSFRKYTKAIDRHTLCSFPGYCCELRFVYVVVRFSEWDKSGLLRRKVVFGEALLILINQIFSSIIFVSSWVSGLVLGVALFICNDYGFANRFYITQVENTEWNLTFFYSSHWDCLVECWDWYIIKLLLRSLVKYQYSNAYICDFKNISWAPFYSVIRAWTQAVIVLLNLMTRLLHTRSYEAAETYLIFRTLYIAEKHFHPILNPLSVGIKVVLLYSSRQMQNALL